MVQTEDKAEENIELRSEEFQEVLGAVPLWILRWGITLLAIVIVVLLTGSALIKYPDVIPAQIVLTGSTPPATIVAHASGKLKELYVSDNKEVKTGDYLAVIDNPAKTEDILFLKNYLDTLSSPPAPLQYGEGPGVRSAPSSNSTPLSPPPFSNTPNTNACCIIHKKRR